MKLRNKKTGEIGNLVLNINPNRESFSVTSTENGDTACGNLVLADYDSLAELNEEWEDALEEEVWYLGEEIGNYALPKEEARKITKKILAWKRLKEKGFRFTGLKKIYQGRSSSLINYNESPTYISFNKATEDFVSPTGDWVKENWDDLQLIFGGEE